MKVLIYASLNDHSEFMVTVDKVFRGHACIFDFVHFDDYDQLRRSIAAEHPDLVIVYSDGAHGMEMCIGIRKISPSVPLFWFSDDIEFGPQSYRLDCTYFGKKPVSPDRLKSAFGKLSAALS